MSQETQEEAPQGEAAGEAPASDRAETGADAAASETAEAGARAEAPPRRGRGGGGGTQEIPLGKYVKIDPTQRLPKFDRGTAEAYVAVDSRQPGMAAYALVCTEEMPPRLEALPSLSRLDKQNFVPPVDWGPIPWGDEDTWRYAVVFDQPGGEALTSDPYAPIEPIREEKLVERIIRPFSTVLRELATRSTPHRAICVHNIFTGDSPSHGMVLGECVGTPPGMVQPPIYETIDSAQADPIGRGAGSVADDMYALGILLAVLIRGGDPMANLSAAEIVSRKIEAGSYAAVLGRTRVSLKLMEPLRGLLCDDPLERWHLEDLDMWLNGRQLSPKQANLPQKARRAFRFEGKEFWDPRTLAHGLAQNWRPAAKVAVAGELESWILRSLDDQRHAQLINTLMAGARSAQGSQSEDRALARALVALDPPAPLRLRSISVRVEAIPQALALAYHHDDQRNTIADAILNKLPQRWLQAQADAQSQDPRVTQSFERMALYISRQTLGFGLERCLYDYNPGWPCISPMVRGQFVSSIDRLLPALERYAARHGTDGTPVDRHVVAYIGARMEPAPEKILEGLGKAKDEITRRRAIIHLLARVQKRYGPRSLPAYAAWVAEYARPIAEALHNRRLRDRAEKNLKRAIESGSLVDVVAAVDDTDSKRKDVEGFAAAQREYAELAREIAWLQDGGLTSEGHIAKVTRSAATATSALCSGVILMLLTLVFVL